MKEKTILERLDLIEKYISELQRKKLQMAY